MKKFLVLLAYGICVLTACKKSADIGQITSFQYKGVAMHAHTHQILPSIKLYLVEKKNIDDVSDFWKYYLCDHSLIPTVYRTNYIILDSCVTNAAGEFILTKNTAINGLINPSIVAHPANYIRLHASDEGVNDLMNDTCWFDNSGFLKINIQATNTQPTDTFYQRIYTNTSADFFYSKYQTYAQYGTTPITFYAIYPKHKGAYTEIEHRRYEALNGISMSYYTNVMTAQQDSVTVNLLY